MMVASKYSDIIYLIVEQPQSSGIISNMRYYCKLEMILNNL